MGRYPRIAALVVTSLLALAPPARAQQLEPRAFAPNPAGVSFLSLSAGRTEGDVLLDTSAPIRDFEVSFNDYVLGYLRTFALADVLASFALALPYVTADATGLVQGQPQAVSRAGWGDLRMRFTFHLIPGSALDPAAFAQRAPRDTLGVSLLVVAPTGEYREDELVNIGANRWAFKPEFGGYMQRGRWALDGSVGAWFFSDNEDFLGDSTKSQDTIGVLQAHLSYTFAPRFWLGLGLTGYLGGSTAVDGQEQDDQQGNTRVGLTLAIPVARQHSIKLGWSTGTSTRAGGDFDSLHLAWQYSWFH